MRVDGMRSSRVVVLALIAGAFFTAQEAFMDVARGGARSVPGDIWSGVQIWGVWALLTPLVFVALRRWPVDVRPLAPAVMAHLFTAVALSSVRNLVGTFLLRAGLLLQGAMTVRDAVTTPPNAVAFVSGVFTGVLYYALVVMVYTALRFRRSAEALEVELARSKLDTLRSQLRPHFLFNTLNALFGLIVEDPAKAQQMVLHLSRLLRRSLDEEAHEVPLRRELAYLDDYLEIQRARFGDRLRVVVAVDPAVLDAAVPVLLLQPLVENAIEHGESADRCTRIRVQASGGDGVLRIAIQDDGPGLANSVPLREGIGLRNTRARLYHLYGPIGSVALMPANAGPDSAGARVEILLPMRTDDGQPSVPSGRAGPGRGAA